MIQADGLTRRTIVRLAMIAVLALPLESRIARASEVTEPIEALDRTLLELMKSGPTTPFRRRFDILAPFVDRALDLPAILHACVGTKWASLGAGEQARLLDIFRKFTVASYVANFDSFAGEGFDLDPNIRVQGTDQIVQTRITAPNMAPVRVDYVMHQTADGWRAVDVLLDGTISRVAVQRSDFRNLLGSGDASQLIASLRRKVADLSGGAVAT